MLFPLGLFIGLSIAINAYCAYFGHFYLIGLYNILAGISGFFLYKKWLQLQKKLCLLEQLNCAISCDLTIFDECGKSIYSNKRKHIKIIDYIDDLERRYRVCSKNQDFFDTVRVYHHSEALLQERKTRKSFICEFKSLYDNQYHCFLLRNYACVLDYFNELEGRYRELENFIDNAHFGLIYTDLRDHIIGLNKEAEKILPCDVLNQHMKDVFPDLTDHYTVIDDLNMFIFAAGVSNSVKTYLLLPHQDTLCQTSAFSVSRIPSVLIKGDGDIIEFNEAFSDIACVQKGDNFFDLLHPSLQSEIECKYTRVIENKNPITPYESRFKDSDIFTTTYTSRIMSNHSFLLQFIDISERKQLEQQFIQSQKMQAVGQLAGGVAHDFNNLLTAILGFCDLLLQRYLPNDPSYTDLIQIKQNATRASSLVRQLLAFSRKQNLKPKIINITDVLAELSALLRRLLGASIELDMVHGKDLWNVKVDISQFEQVIINLAVNARDAMQNEGLLIIKTENVVLSKDETIANEVIPKGHYVMITVEDNGCGIAPEAIEHIFEPFFSTKEIGSGLGLSTVYGIIKQTGGFINVKSGKKGTKFTIYLPASEGEVCAIVPSPCDTTLDLSGKERILFVEDEEAVRLFGARALREKGYDVVEAASGEEALRCIESGSVFDLVVSDIVMPKMDGMALCKIIQEKHNHTRVLFISGYSKDILKHDNDHIFFLPKPFSIKELAFKVKEILTSTNLI